MNGVDYEFIAIGHKFEVGQEFVEIKVSPFVDSVIEPTEIVEFGSVHQMIMKSPQKIPLP